MITSLRNIIYFLLLASYSTQMDAAVETNYVSPAIIDWNLKINSRIHELGGSISVVELEFNNAESDWLKKVQNDVDNLIENITNSIEIQTHSKYNFSSCSAIGRNEGFEANLLSYNEIHGCFEDQIQEFRTKVGKVVQDGKGIKSVIESIRMRCALGYSLNKHNDCVLPSVRDLEKEQYLIKFEDNVKQLIRVAQSLITSSDINTCSGKSQTKLQETLKKIETKVNECIENRIKQ